jgi:hypothetical protein
MNRTRLLTFSAVVAVAVGLFALGLPRALLASKGVAPSPAAVVWVREVGVLILSLGVMAWMVRREPDSVAMRAILVANAIVHLGLFPIEIAAFHDGVITAASGILPNSVLHVALGTAFALLARRGVTRAGRVAVESRR